VKIHRTKFRIALVESGRPQYVIAAAAGLSPSAVSAMLHGLRPVTEVAVRALASALGVAPEQLLAPEEADGAVGAKS
jgi:transcriptional regulator with XRE-family HTH domain